MADVRTAISQFRKKPSHRATQPVNAAATRALRSRLPWAAVVLLLLGLLGSGLMWRFAADDYEPLFQDLRLFHHRHHWHRHFEYPGVDLAALIAFEARISCGSFAQAPPQRPPKP